MESSAPMTYAKALELLGSVGRAALLSTEMIALELGLGRILSEDIYSPEQHPPWNCSAMDGFAVRSSSLLPFSAQSVHKILGTIAAGDATLKATEAQNSFDGVWEIMTGAPLPHDFDSVVRSEDSLILEDVEPGKRAVQFTVAVTPDKNVRQKGEDFFIGQKLFPQGHKLRASDLLCLATLGIAKISVRRKLRVGLVSTGNELIAISAQLQPGKIRNSSALYLKTELHALGVEVTDLGVVDDRAESLAELIGGARVNGLDLILSTGAVSIGKFDFVGRSLELLKAKIEFKKVQVRPAKPILFASIPPTLKGAVPLLYLGLPGQPVATAVSLRFFFAPLLNAMNATRDDDPGLMPLAEPTTISMGWTNFLRGTIIKSNEGQRVLVHKRQQPSLLSPLLDCDVWIKLESSRTVCPAGELVETYPI